VARVHRHGKRLLVELDRGASLALHLGMSGRIVIVPSGEAVMPHTHLRIALDDGSRELRMQDPRRFGGAALRTSSENGAAARRNGANFGPLGPDALAIPLRDWRALLARPRAIKALLLDQAAIAGLGNIYVDEILWASRIHPLTRASRSRGPHRRSHRHLNAIGPAAPRTTTAPGAGNASAWHQVYGREGEPCFDAARRSCVDRRGALDAHARGASASRGGRTA
jgi:formamidopyrimidine-DNA glycosylase